MKPEILISRQAKKSIPFWLKKHNIPELPDELNFLDAGEILDMYPGLPRKQREITVLQKYPAIFIYGIGRVLEDGYRGK